LQAGGAGPAVLAMAGPMFSSHLALQGKGYYLLGISNDLLCIHADDNVGRAS